jgi:CheY-like chemotaxis protein
MIDLNRKIVLLVDDDANVRRMVRDQLESFGVHVLEADEAPKAVKLAMDTPLKLDLLVTDVLLPFINGRDLAERICASRPDLKALFISGYPLEVLESHGLCPSRAQLLLKPFSRLALGEKISDILSSGPP